MVGVYTLCVCVTFGPPQHEPEPLLLSFLQLHGLLLQRAVTVEEAAREAPVSAARHAHQRPAARPRVHGELERVCVYVSACA